VKVFRLELDDYRVVEGLIVSGRLSEAAALDHHHCESALAAVAHKRAHCWLQ